MSLQKLEWDGNFAAAIQELERQVSGILRRQVRHFRLEVTEGGLVLLGRSQTYYAKQLAQHALMAATDVPIAANLIEVFQLPE